MANTNPTKRFSETLTSFYIETFVSEADRVYRLALGTMLSHEKAKQVVESVFREVAANLTRLSEQDPGDADIKMLKSAWSKISTTKAGASDTNSTDLSLAMKGMTAESRAALVAVDVLGLASDEMKEVFGWDESNWRSHLAAAREKLMSSSFGKVTVEQIPVVGDIDDK